MINKSKAYKPVVSICCITFNHEAYIREAIEGFILQKTNFPIEILIHDDASTDNTSTIIKEYELKFPELIKPIYQKENQYSQGVRPISKFNFERSKGKYIAVCEGDDYWTDPFKLQKQVDILEQNKNGNIVAVVTNASSCNKKGIILKEIAFNFKEKNESCINNLHDFFKNKTRYPTPTIVFKNELSDIIPNLVLMQNLFLGDWILWILLHLKGDFYILNVPTTCYRVHENSLTHTVNAIERWKYDFIIRKQLKNIIPDEYHKYLNENWYPNLRIATAYRKQKKHFYFFLYMGFSFFSNPIKLFREISKNIRCNF